MNIYEVGKTVRIRRLAVGLTQQRLAKLAGLSRQTVQQLEAGTIGDLSFGRVLNLLGVLGLNFAPPSIKSRKKKCGLWMAAKNASVSYRGELTAEQLQQALATVGDVDRANQLREASPHWLRHTFAKGALLSGQDIRHVAALLGHSDLATTMVYTEQDALDLIRATNEVVPGMLASEPIILIS